MSYPVNNLGSIGIISDLPAQELPLNAWTDGRNVRFRDGAVEKFTGHIEVYATPNVAPYFLLPVPSPTAFFWVYAGLAKVGATDGSTHADITRAVGGDYTTDANIGWTGTVFEGFAILNNGADIPQMWTPSLANDLVNLTAWDTNWRARSLRSIKRYLVALDITKTATRHPYMIKWSHQAPSNSVPTSWNEADQTVDAGEWNLSSEGGFILDAIPLRDDLIVYKESQTWLMQYIGGIEVFRFLKKFGEIGALSRKCAIEFFSGKHCVFAGDDLILHDGQQAVSLLTDKMRKSMLNRIDSGFYSRSFVVANYPGKEVWACFPEVSQPLPNIALVWNWEKNTVGLRELPGTPHIAAGIVNPVATTETWGGAVGTWETDTVSWGDRSFDPSQRKMLMAAPNVTKLYNPDTSNQFDGVNMTAFVERKGLGFPLKKDQPPDYETVKRLRGIWPRISGTVGGVVNVYAGVQNKVDGPITYDVPFPFVIGTSDYVDCLGALPSSRLHALKFESTSDIAWRLEGYEVDVVRDGSYAG